MTQHSISLRLVMDELNDVIGDIARLREELSHKIIERDRLMVELKAGRIPRMTIARLTGLSTDRVKQITAGAHTAASIDVSRWTEEGLPATKLDRETNPPRTR